MFLSWVKYHGRSQDLASRLAVGSFFISSSQKSIIRRYFDCARQTRNILRDSDSHVVFLMLPPAPALVSVLMFRRKGTRIVADLHTGFFMDPKWKWFKRTGLWLLRNELVLVTNAQLAAVAEKCGNKAMVLHDPLSIRFDESAAADDGTVLCPLSYANDEPVQALIDVTKSLPQVQFKFSGKAPDWVIANSPPNVSFTGYVSNEQFQKLLMSAALICALTTRDLTMQRAGYEALMAGKAQITSDFPVLREFLGKSAVYVDPANKLSIAGGIRDALETKRVLAMQARTTLQDRVQEQEKTLSRLQKLLESQ